MSDELAEAGPRAASPRNDMVPQAIRRTRYSDVVERDASEEE